MGVADASDSRLADLARWVRQDLGFVDCGIAPASADASFRRYFRVTRDGESFIVMDAPPDKEDLAPFLEVGALLADTGLNVPIALARDVTRGFLLLTDLGTRQYLDELTAAPDAVDALYIDALAALLTMQAITEHKARQLPRYDRAMLMREMSLMPEWFLTRHLGLALDEAEAAMLGELFDTLSQAALEQPQSFVHRDFHSRNLLRTAAENPGVLDFQDAVWGPVTYDLASLLKDCYIAWPPARVRAWVLAYRAQLLRAGFELGEDEAQFVRWFDLIGLQRHLKVLGIFARLHYRDGKPQYLYDLPRVLNYVKHAAVAYPETAQFAQFVVDRIEPLFSLAQAAAMGKLREQMHAGT